MVRRKTVERIEWPAELLEKGREFRFLRDPEYKDFLAKVLQLSDGMSVVDVGCGTGVFSRLITEWVRPTGKVVGVDIDERLLDVAKKRADEAGSSALMEFKRGDAYNLPVPDGSADVTFCRTVLWLLESPVKALKEMFRVVRPGGMVAAVDVDSRLWLFYDPKDERYTDLLWKDQERAARGTKKLYKSDMNIGRKLPYLFREAGLTDVRAYGKLQVNLRSDLRDRTPEQEAEIFRWRLKFLTSKDPWFQKRRDQLARARLAGGMTRAEIDEFLRRTINRLRAISRNPAKLRDDFSLFVMGELVVTGRKPSK